MRPLGNLMIAAGWIVCICAAMLGVLLYAGCARSVPTEEPTQARERGWCVRAEMRLRGEQVEICSETLRTCKRAQRAGSEYLSGYLGSIGECRRER